MVWKLIVFITQGPWKSDCWGIPGTLHNLQKGSVGWVSLWLQGSFYTWKLKHWLFRGNRPDQRTRLPYFYRVECCKEKSLKQQGCHRIDKKSKIPDNVFDFFFSSTFWKVLPYSSVSVWLPKGLWHYSILSVSVTISAFLLWFYF